MPRTLKQIRHEIDIVCKKLKRLRDERNALMPKPRKRPTIEEKIKTLKERDERIGTLLENKKSINQISDIMQMSPGHARYLAWSYIHHQANEEMLIEEKATVLRPNEWGGESWEVDYTVAKKKQWEINLRVGEPFTWRKFLSEKPQLTEKEPA